MNVCPVRVQYCLCILYESGPLRPTNKLKVVRPRWTSIWQIDARGGEALLQQCNEKARPRVAHRNDVCNLSSLRTLRPLLLCPERFMGGTTRLARERKRGRSYDLGVLSPLVHLLFFFFFFFAQRTLLEMK